jgi:hypothetical protein
MGISLSANQPGNAENRVIRIRQDAPSDDSGLTGATAAREGPPGGGPARAVLSFTEER